MRKSKLFTKVAAGTLAVCMVGTTVLSGNIPVNVLAADAVDNEWQQIQDVVSRYYGEWNNPNYPGLFNNQMPNTALLGNGDVGVASGGSNTEKKFYLSKGDFWAYTGSQLSIGGVTIKEGKKQEVIVEEGENIAPTYKTVTASSYHDSFTPDKAVNGKMEQSPYGYGWVTSVPGVNGQKANDFWLQLEYEEAITISRYVVKSDGAVRDGVEANNTSDFKLQVSNDGATWTDVDTVTGNKDAVVDRELEEAATGKFVRLYITKATQETTDDSRRNPRARIAQLELYAEAENPNIATTYKNVSASNTMDGNVAGFGPQCAVDGFSEPNEEWHGWCTNIGKEQWLQLEFEEAIEIARYGIKSDAWARPQYKPEISANTASDFKLQVSDDGETWTDADTVVGNKDDVFAKNLEKPVKAKFVRLYITKPTQETTADTQKNPRARVAQFELYAKAEETEKPVEPEEPLPEQDFYEKQDILNAEIQTKQVLTHTPTEMKTWLAADDNIMVTELVSKDDKERTFEVETWAANNNKALRPITAANDEDSVTVTRTSENSKKSDEESWTSKAALSTKVIGADDVETTSDNANGKGTLTFTLKPGEPVYIVTSVGGGGRTYTNTDELWEGAKEPAADAEALLDKVADEKDVTALNEDRQAWWKDYWSASYVDFGTEDERLNQAQKYYYGAQYILGSTAKEGELAPGLYGVWRTNDTPGWHGDWHMNYNLISTVYGASSSNRPELLLPMTEALYSYIPTGEKMAGSVKELKNITRNMGYGNNQNAPYYDAKLVDDKIAEGKIDAEKGIEGAILFPVGIGPWGSTTDPITCNETIDAAYNSMMFTQYYDYTEDKAILEKAYEFLKKCATFYEAWLTEEDGRYNLYAGWCETTWAKNPAVELAAVQNVFRNVISMSKILGVDEEKLPLWEKIYEDMSIKPTWEVDGKTVYGLAEKRLDAEADANGEGFTFWGGIYGNPVMLDYFMPGETMGYFSTPEELEIARNTINMYDRGTNNIVIQGINNFPRIFAYAVRSRYDIDKLMDYFYGEITGSKMAPNLRIVDGNHGVEKCGGTEAINSMMLASDKGINKIFPNWFEDKDAKFANLRARGAFTVSAEYDGTAKEAKNVVINSEKGNTMTLVSPWAEGAKVVDSNGNPVEVTEGTVAGWEDVENMTITFDTKAGETYTVEKDAKEEADKEWLSALIDYAHSQQEQEEYQYLVPAVKVPFEKALEEAVAVNEKANATQAEVDAAYDKLLDMVHYLGFTGNSDSLKVLADSARGLNPDLFTEETWAVLEDALAKADAVLANENALQAEIDVARDVLQDAIDGLVRVPVDKDALKKLIDKSQKYVDKIDQYTDGTAKIFTDVLAEAVATYDNADASQKDVDAAYAALQNAIFQLRLKPNKDKLDDLIKAAEKVDTSKYTEESAAAFKAALDDAKAVFADGEATKEEVKAAEKALKDAQKNLVAKADTDKKGNDKVASNDGNNNTNSGAKSQPKTGDAATVWTMLLGCMAAVAAVGTVVIRRKRR